MGQYMMTHTKGGAKGLASGFSSDLERRTAAQLKAAGMSFDYEAHTIHFTQPAEHRRYTPDFVLANGIIIEVKGLWETADRKKHKLIAAQHPHLDIRFVFSNEATTIGKKSNTTYAMYCEKLGIPYATRQIPPAWLTEPRYEKRCLALFHAKTTP
jgi:Autographiviridae endonuclease I